MPSHHRTLTPSGRRMRRSSGGFSKRRSMSSRRRTAYRTVFMLRDVEGLSTSEAGEGLGLGEEAVKTRLHRARAMLRRSVTARVGVVAAGAFEFHAPRCDRVVAAVLARIMRS